MGRRSNRHWLSVLPGWVEDALPDRAEVDVATATERLVRWIKHAGVGAVVTEVEARPALLLPLADACRRAGLIAAAQYLVYLYLPYD